MWEDKIDYFTEKERHYNDTYLEISEVLDNTIEASLFSSEVGDYEIYVCYERMVTLFMQVLKKRKLCVNR